jgi:ribose transport system permease protein
MSVPPATEPSVATVPPVAGDARRRPALKHSTLRDYGIVVFLVVLFVVLCFSSDVFLTSNNLKNVIDGAVPMGMIACAGTLVIIAGGFDLSAGAIFAVAAIIGAKVCNASNPEVAILAGVAVGAGLGLVNGLLCTVGRINDFVGTLGTSIAYQGMATAISGSSLIIINDQAFGNLSDTQVAGIKMGTLILLGSALLCALILNRTVLGRHVFGTGGNRKAARLSGVPVNRTLAATYVLSGTLAGLAGLIVASRTLSVNASTGSNIIFDALAAILIGGNSVLGGEGAIWRTMVGVAILALISNGFNLLGIDPLYQQIVNGTIILVAVGMDAWARRRTA